MSSQACPFWMGYLLLCPFRRLGQNPDKILRPYVSNGMTVLEVGPGMGFFTGDKETRDAAWEVFNQQFPNGWDTPEFDQGLLRAIELTKQARKKAKSRGR